MTKKTEVKEPSVKFFNTTTNNIFTTKGRLFADGVVSLPESEGDKHPGLKRCEK